MQTCVVHVRRALKWSNPTVLPMWLATRGSFSHVILDSSPSDDEISHEILFRDIRVLGIIALHGQLSELLIVKQLQITFLTYRFYLHLIDCHFLLLYFLSLSLCVCMHFVCFFFCFRDIGSIDAIHR